MGKYSRTIAMMPVTHAALETFIEVGLFKHKSTFIRAAIRAYAEMNQMELDQLEPENIRAAFKEEA